MDTRLHDLVNIDKSYFQFFTKTLTLRFTTHFFVNLIYTEQSRYCQMKIMKRLGNKVKHTIKSKRTKKNDMLPHSKAICNHNTYVVAKQQTITS